MHWLESGAGEDISLLEYEKHVFRSQKFRSVVDEAIAFFLTTPPHRLPQREQFMGSGVYALYYVGNFGLYQPLAELNKKGPIQPIYVGKAVPPGWRTGRIRKSDTADLHGRLAEHAHSIQQTSNLDVAHFLCRFMILTDVEGDLVVPVEAELIRRYRPLWNMAIDGFGNHDPGAGRYNQAISEWDVLHPGRSWVQRMKGKPPKLEKIVAKVKSQQETQEL